MRELYGVDVDVLFNEQARHLMVVGARRAPMNVRSQPAAVATAAAPAPRPRRCARVSLERCSAFGALAALVCLLGAARRHHAPSTLGRAFDRSIPFQDNVDAQIFFVARLPRVVAGALVGAALAVAGVVFQALLRNPLATPFTLGVSAGASLGAMMVIIFGGFAAVGPWSPVPIASLAGRGRGLGARLPAGHARRAAPCPPPCCCWRA